MSIRSTCRNFAIALSLAVCALAISAQTQSSRAKNIIIFMGDGTGVSSLNAASIYGYNKPLGLYIRVFQALPSRTPRRLRNGLQTEGPEQPL